MVAAKPMNQAMLLGFATGIRSMTGVAALGWAASSGRVGFGERWPFSLLDQPLASKGLLAAAGGEMIVDKLPFTPARTHPVPLLARMSVGAFVGAAVCAAEQQSVWTGAGVGAVAALFGSFAGYGMRSQVVASGVPALPAAMVGDALAVALSGTAVLQSGSAVA